jgi:predicted O-linked N-acetylglucosamine transferase (SPINDLY family)
MIADIRHPAAPPAAPTATVSESSLARPEIDDLMAAGLVHHRAGRIVEAEAAYRQVLRHDPAHARALHLLGLTAHQAGNYAIAAAFVSKALALEPDNPALLRNLGNALHEQGRLQEAVAQYERAISIKPDFAAAHNDLANTLLAQGQPRKAVARYRKSLRVKPDAAATHSNLLFAMHYSEAYSRLALKREARRWAARHADYRPPAAPGYEQTADPDRRLRVGFVSADFRMHSVAYLLAPVLAALDRDQFDVTCYTNDWRHDAMTTRLQGLADRWRNIVGLPDDDVDAMIRSDCIDILVDLSGHTAGNRLTVFARHPAPVTLSWLGYSDTTGMAAMDYIVVDPIVCPVDDIGAVVERPIHLPASYVCYEPLAIAPGVSTEHLTARAPTFGCFNNLAKVTPEVVAVWSAILRRLPDATLLLKTASLDDPVTRTRYRRLFRSHGVGESQVRMLGKTRQSAVLGQYNEIHVALDPFPYNGTVTSLESLWMGVPFVTLRGDRFVGRVGESLLTAVGLPDLVADTRDAYVEQAVSLAQDRDRLVALRNDLRRRITTGPLGDHQQFARHLEGAWRRIWTTWCDGRNALTSVTA